MINIRKIILLSALLMSASSIPAPTYAMLDDEQEALAQRVIRAKMPYKLTLEIISEIKQHGSLLTVAKEHVLQNPEQLDSFRDYLNSEKYDPYQDRNDYLPLTSPFQEVDSDDYNSLHHYIIVKNNISLRPNPNYDPARPEETSPKSFQVSYHTDLSRLTFKEQELAPAKPSVVAPKVEEQGSGSGAASSVQAPVSSDPSSEDAEKAMIIRSLIEAYKSEPVALGEAMAAFWKNLN